MSNRKVNVRVQQTRNGWAPVVDAAGLAFTADFSMVRRDAAQGLADILSGKSRQDFVATETDRGVVISISTEKGRHTFSAKVPEHRVSSTLRVLTNQQAQPATPAG